MSMNYWKSASVAALMASVAAPAMADDVEVLHLWTSAGQAAAVATLQGLVEGAGHTWVDFAVAGGGGENLMTVLRTRVIAGDPPAAAQMKAPVVREYASEGYLVDLQALADEEGWDDLLSPAIQELVQIDGQYFAAPVNIHRIDWMWVNPTVLEAAGVEVPTTWDEFFAAADAIQEAGYVAFAHGGQNWQDITVFETVVLGVAGADFYRRAFVELDPDAARAPEMAEAFEVFRRLGDYVDAGSPGRSWNETTAMLVRDEAAFQIMGDWVKGEFTAAGLTPGEDYLCVDVPGTQDAYIYNTDSFGLFALPDGESSDGQMALASAIMSMEFQVAFNIAKGSIPVRNDVDMSDFDECAQLSMTHLQAADAAGGTVPSLAHNMATSPSILGASRDVITQFWNQPDMTVAEAQERLAAALSDGF